MKEHPLLLFIFALLFIMPVGNIGRAAPLPSATPAIAGPRLRGASFRNNVAKKDSTVAEKTNKKVQQIKQLFSTGVIVSILLIILLTYFLIRLLVRIIDNLSERASKYRLTIKRLVPVTRILLWAVALYIIIAGIINPPFKTVLAVAASVGIAVGLASQDILKNVFGGFMIILDKPFQVGDKIRVDEHYGEVQQIGLRSTRIFTPDDSVVSVPNGDAISKAVLNVNTGELHGQVVAEIYLPADVDIAWVKQMAYKAAVSSRYVYLKKPVVVIVKNEVHEKNFVIKLRVKAYVLDIRFEFPFQSDMTEQILAECNRRKMIHPSNGIS